MLLDPRKLEGRGRSAAIAAAVAVVSAAVAMVLYAGSDDVETHTGTVVVERRSFSATVMAVGAVKPQIGAEVRVGSRISGRVQRLRANIGDRVERGQVIAELETADLDAVLAHRRAELRLAEARLASLGSLLPAELERSELEVARWQATAERAAGEWARVRQLLEQRVVSAAEAEAAREQNAVAQAQLSAARNALELLRARRAEERKQAEAELDRARAALESAAVDRSFARLAAPIGGVIGSVSTQEGETVAAGLNAPTFVTIIDLDRLQVDAYVDEVDIGKIAIGQRAGFTVDAYPAEDFTGRVAAVYPSATIQDNVVKYIVAITLEGDHGGRLRPEMTASVRILLDSREVLALPARAIRREAGRSVVYVAGSGRRPESRAVRIGWRDGTWVEVVEGVDEGERVYLELPAEAGEGVR